MERLRQLYALLENDVERMLTAYAGRIAGHDDVRLDAATRTATFLKNGAVLWRAFAEPLGRLNPAFKAFRWWWYGREPPTSPNTRRDTIVIEGQRFGIAPLTTAQVPVASDDEAQLLCTVAARLAGAEGMVRMDDAHGALFVALFETPGVATPSLFPPPTSFSPFPSMQAVRVPEIVDTSPGAADVLEGPPKSDGPRRYTIPAPIIASTSGVRMPTFVVRSPSPSSNAPVSEPARDVLAPLLEAAFGAAVASMPDGFIELVLVVLVDVMHNETRAFVQLVALARSSQIVSLDVGVELANAAEAMIAADAASGNGRWSKLVARMRRNAHGATVEVEVKV